ncbi:MAG: hypothetical protein KatS3mg131_2890 [Candidatus Tectimicrobiota bacterium]|nr:MAG: hypothetical protein KatS3mg131_2890 [Candidatus Tectomicrobia bacterium]
MAVRPRYAGAFFLCWLVGLAVGGCGYRMVGHGGAAAPAVLAVAPFANRTREPGLETYMTAALRQALVRHPPFRLAAEEAAAWRVTGVVRRFRAVPVSFTAADTVLQYRLEAVVAVRLAEPSAAVPLLEQELSVWTVWLVSSTGDVRANTVAKEAALWRLAQQFAERCVALLVAALL